MGGQRFDRKRQGLDKGSVFEDALTKPTDKGPRDMYDRGGCCMKDKETRIQAAPLLWDTLLVLECCVTQTHYYQTEDVAERGGGGGPSSD